MNKVITKNCFLLFCVFLGWWSPSTAETQWGDTISQDIGMLKIPNVDNLIKNLKEIFNIREKKYRNPLEHELLRKLISRFKLEDLSEIKSISYYIIGDVEFQIWKFDSKDNAKLYFDIMKKVVWTVSFYEKPPKCFFLVSDADELYYFTTCCSNKRTDMFQIVDKLINCCFSKSEVQFARDPYR